MTRAARKFSKLQEHKRKFSEHFQTELSEIRDQIEEKQEIITEKLQDLNKSIEYQHMIGLELRTYANSAENLEEKIQNLELTGVSEQASNNLAKFRSISEEFVELSNIYENPIENRTLPNYATTHKMFNSSILGEIRANIEVIKTENGFVEELKGTFSVRVVHDGL